MNRREFVRALGIGAAAAAAPGALVEILSKIPAPAPLPEVDAYAMFQNSLRRIYSDEYFVSLRNHSNLFLNHPGIHAKIVDIADEDLVSQDDEPWGWDDGT